MMAIGIMTRFCQHGGVGVEIRRRHIRCRSLPPLPLHQRAATAIIPRTTTTTTTTVKAVTPRLSSVQRPLSQLSSTSLFALASGRARQRRRNQPSSRRLRLRLRRESNNNNSRSSSADDASSSSSIDNQISDSDSRTVMDILFPNPFRQQDLERRARSNYPRTLAAWRHILMEAWIDYRWTWRGFWSSRGFIVDDHEDNNDNSSTTTTNQSHEGKTANMTSNNKIDERKVEEKQDAEMIRSKTHRVSRNIKFIRVETRRLQRQVSDQTGIYTTDDLKRVAEDILQLASTTVKAFMDGYRKGRDDEVEKMLHQYFQELQDKVENDKDNQQRRRRKIKRRVLV